MEVIIGIGLLIVAIAFWQIAVGVVIGAVVGSFFGDVGGVIGAAIGFFGGLGAFQEAARKKTGSTGSGANTPVPQPVYKPAPVYSPPPPPPKQYYCVACGSTCSRSGYTGFSWGKPKSYMGYLCNATGQYGYKCDCSYKFHSPHKMYAGQYIPCPSCGSDRGLTHWSSDNPMQ